MDLIVGATGYLGSEIGRLLASRGRSVRGLYRKNSPGGMIRKLKENSVELFESDLRDQASLSEACAGIKTVISTATAIRSLQDEDNLETVDYYGHLNLIEAALEARVKRFIFISYPAVVNGNDPATNAKRMVERRLKESGLDYTIIRPALFMEFWLCPAMGFDYSAGAVTIYGDGENKICWISVSDAAQFVIQTIDSPEVRNETVELLAGDYLSPAEVVRIFETAAARPFDVQYIPVTAIRDQIAIDLRPQQQAYLTLLLAYTRGFQAQPEAEIQKLIGTPVSVRGFAQRVLSAASPVTTHFDSLQNEKVRIRFY